MKTRAKPESPTAGTRALTEDLPLATDSIATPDSDPGREPTTGNCRLTTVNSPCVPPGREKTQADRLEAERLQACQRCCQNCAFAMRPKTQWFRILLADFPGLWACFNHPNAPGEMTETARLSVCRNFRYRHQPSLRLDAPAPPGPGVRVIPLTRGKHAYVDAEDYDRLMKHKWTALYTGGKWYATRNDHGKCILMHREIMKAPKGKVVDHIDGNGLNNCKSNLRICTQGQNLCNSRPRGKTSVFKGVFYDKERGKYKAFVWENGATAVIGRYDDPIEAAKARDYRAVQLQGEYAYLNFPTEWPKERVQEVYAQARALRDRLETRSDKRKVISDKKGAGQGPSKT